MAAMTSRSVVCFTVRFITLFTSFSLTISSQPSTEVNSLIYSLQNKYCGRQFCSSDPSKEGPFCEENIEPITTDTLTNHTRQTVDSRNRQLRPPCSECSCSDSCSLHGDCCADKLIDREYFFDCQKIPHYNQRIVQTMFSYVVTKCLQDTPNFSEDLAEKCEHGELGYIPDGRLVTALHPKYNTKVTFRNKYCAMCYNVTNYTPWDVYITCDEDLDSSNHTDMNSLIRSVKDSSVCTVTLDHPDAAYSPICERYHGMISTCNETGKWQEYNETLEAACHYYLNPTLTYRNIFCALCNGINGESLMCPTGDYVLPNIPMYFQPFSAILNFDKSDVEVIKGRSAFHPIRRIGRQEEHQCRTEDVFDIVSSKCREVYCPLAISNGNTTCIELVPSETYVVTTWMLTAYYIDDIIFPFGVMFSNIGGSVIDALQGYLTECGFALSGSYQSDFASIYTSDSLILKESQLEVELLLLPRSRLEIARQRLMDMKNLTLNITWLGETKHVNVVLDSNPRNVTNMLMMPTFSSMKAAHLQFQDMDFSKAVNVPLAFNVSCPLIRFDTKEVLSINKSVFLHGNILLEDEYFAKDKDNYFVCFNAAFRPQTVQTVVPTKPSDEFRIEQLVTVVCFSCSLIFLILTMLVYILIRQLHTVPGLNLTLLTFSLFVAQALYFFGAGAGYITTATVCTVIGVLIHYFWLVSFAWMNICSVHMIRVFANLFNSLDFADDKKGVLLKYSAFAFGSPLLIVGITTITSYITSGYTSIGYGSSTLCFSVSGLTSILSFGVPAGVTVLTNTILLIYTMVHIRRAKKGPGGKERAGTSDIVKFFKLSTITGVSWLFGFLGYFFKRVELLYVFTVLTAGQGVFIFLSFVVSRRILNLLKERFDCLQKDGDVIKRCHGDTFNGGVTSSEFMSTRHI